MPESVLTTKLHTPSRRDEAVARRRLTRRMDEAHKLVLVSAPAGSGKTTLVGQWLAERGLPVAWLSLDSGDSDPTRFLSCLVAALRTVEVGIGDGVTGMLASPRPPLAEVVASVLLNDIAAAFGEDFVLVLDDLHAVESRWVDDALAAIVEGMPPRMRLVIATREDPNLPLARLRARSHLTEIRASDLRFTLPEASEFLRDVMGIDLSTDDIIALESRTEGWVSGLQLAAVSMRGRDDASTFIESFTGSHRFILDFLLEEVLRAQPEAVQKFLLETSILDRMCAPLCETVSRSSSGQETLEYLERANLFVVPLDDERRWYRYHHLFAEVLRTRLSGEGESRVSDLHRRAYEWHEANGLSEDAIRHALLGGDFERAASLVERASRDMLMGRREDTFIGWVEALPAELVRIRPVLGVYFAIAILSRDLESGEALLRNVESSLNESSLDDGAEGMVVVDERELRALPGVAAIARAYYAGAVGDVSGSVRHARRSLDVLPEDEPMWLGAAATLLGIAHWNEGDLEAAYRFITDGIESFRMAGDTTQTLSGAFILADIRMSQGRMSEAARICERALKLAEGRGSPGAADVLAAMGEIHRERGDLESASRCLKESESLGERGGISENRYRWYVAQARVAEARGDFDAALDLLDEAERVYVPIPDPVSRPITAMKARLWIRQKRFSEAAEWARSLSIHDDLSYLREFEHITLARLLIARHESEGGERLIHDTTAFLERLLEAAEKGGRAGSIVEILALEALALRQKGDIARSLDALDRAITLAEPEGYVRIFVDEGAPMAHLLSEAAAEGVKPEYTQKLLAAFDVGKQSDTRAHLIEPLSEREMEVLRLIARGHSNGEIREKLFLALVTVKGHNRNIFRKLGVKRRTEAVARARELDLL